MSETSQILEKVNETREIIARMDARQEASAKQMAEHRRTLYGNSKKGLVARMQTLEESRRIVYWALGVAWTAAGTVLGAVATNFWMG